MLTEKQVAGNLKKWGFHTFDVEGITSAINAGVVSYVERAKKRGTTQKGGRIVLPSDYFGVPSTSHADAATDAATETAPDMLRAGLEDTFQGGSAGPVFQVPESALKMLSGGICLRSRKCMKAALQNTLTSIFDKVQHKTKGGSHLSQADFEKVWKQKKYTKFH